VKNGFIFGYFMIYLASKPVAGRKMAALGTFKERGIFWDPCPDLRFIRRYMSKRDI
jgi:hypothetical protein